jgi:hypothetical protein
MDMSMGLFDDAATDSMPAARARDLTVRRSPLAPYRTENVFRPILGATLAAIRR